ncbi:MAG: AAA family ATPase [Saprospiraceae bacterium]|nr:AAA family ATPase [Saprospiraceae bacterium]
MQPHEAHFEQLKKLLELEREADLEQYKALIERLPMEQRREKGVTWYPVDVMKSGYTYGDRGFVIVERAAQDAHHQFRAGKPVRLFTKQAGVKRPEMDGVIYYVQKNTMKIILNSKDLPDWLGMGLIGVDLLFDERTYIEMGKALKAVQQAKRDRLAELRTILMGKEEPRFRAQEDIPPHPYLNESQNAAVRQILAAQDVAVVHGPPGTGKTTTLVHAVKLLAEREHTVLVTAPSNTAVDLLTERLAELGLRVVRVGNISRIDPTIVQHSLEAQMGAHPDSKHIKKVKIQAAEARRQARRFKRKFGKEEYMERKHLFKQAGELEAWANQLETRLIDQLLSAAQVITCTLVGAANQVLEQRRFKTLVVDEAAQALEPATWIPIQKASKLILAGDPFQLPPTVKSIEAQRGGLGETLIEKCIRQWGDVSLLKVQYRMHQAIMGFSNAQFYEGQLQAAEAVRTHGLEHGPQVPVAFIDTAGCGFQERINPEYQSRFNPEEFQILCEHLLQLVEPFQTAEEALPSIALISPYREQVLHMQEHIEADGILNKLDLSINTIDGFQGQERDVVYISLVRSNEKSQIGFLSDYRRMNVAMTRARKLLVVVGDSGTIGNDAFYGAFLEYVEQEGLYQTAWEYMQAG